MQANLHIPQSIKLRSTGLTAGLQLSWCQAGSGGSALLPKRMRFTFWDRRVSILKHIPTYFWEEMPELQGRGCTVCEAALLAGVLGTAKKEDFFPLCGFKSQIVWQRDQLLRPKRCCSCWTMSALEASQSISPLNPPLHLFNR